MIALICPIPFLFSQQYLLIEMLNVSATNGTRSKWFIYVFWIGIKKNGRIISRSYNQYFYRYDSGSRNICFLSKYSHKFYLSRMEKIFIYCLTCRSIENSLNPRRKRKRIFFKGRNSWKINTGSFDCPQASLPLHTRGNVSCTYCQHISDRLGWYKIIILMVIFKMVKSRVRH